MPDIDRVRGRGRGPVVTSSLCCCDLQRPVGRSLRLSKAKDIMQGSHTRTVASSALKSGECSGAVYSRPLL